MSMKDEVEQELRVYLEKEHGMLRQDKVSYLLSIFDKHLLFNISDYSMKYYDVYKVINDAKQGMSSLNLPVEISRKRLEPSEVANVAVIEAFISFLNSNEILKKLVKIDYTRGEK